jgi:hypothetical protein
MSIVTQASFFRRLQVVPRFGAVYCEWQVAMAVGNVAEAIASLTPEQQESVILFIEFLKGKDSGPPACSSPFLAAVDEFVDRRPELPRRLAQ